MYIRSEVIRLKVSEAFNNGVIPIKYKNVVPNSCKCGAELEVNDSLTKLWCPSDKCTHNKATRIHSYGYHPNHIFPSHAIALYNRISLYSLHQSYLAYHSI